MVHLEEPVAIMHEEQGGGDYFFADFSSRTIDVIEEKSSYFRLVRRRRGSAHVSMSPDIRDSSCNCWFCQSREPWRLLRV